MIFTESNFNRIKDEESYNLKFNNHQILEEFNSYVENTLETENINILINNIIRIMNIINETDEDNTKLEIKELILKANLSKNSENFKDVLSLLGESSDEKITRINKIVNEKLLDNNLNKKIILLIKLEKLCEYFYPDFSDRLIMESFKEVSKKEKVFIEKEKIEIDYSTLNIPEFCEKLTDEQKKLLIECLSKDENFLDKIKKLSPIKLKKDRK